MEDTGHNADFSLMQRLDELRSEDIRISNPARHSVHEMTTNMRNIGLGSMVESIVTSDNQ